MNELDGHGWHASFSGRMSNDHHLDILVAEGLRTPASHGLLGEKTIENLGLFIRKDFLLFTARGRRRLDCILTKKFLDGTVLWLLTLTIYQLGRPCARITQELVAASKVDAVPFAWEDGCIVCDVKRQDDS